MKTQWAADILDRCITEWTSGGQIDEEAESIRRTCEDTVHIERESGYDYAETIYQALSAWGRGEEITEDHRAGLQRCSEALRSV